MSSMSPAFSYIVLNKRDYCTLKSIRVRVPNMHKTITKTSKDVLTCCNACGRNFRRRELVVFGRGRVCGATKSSDKSGFKIAALEIVLREKCGSSDLQHSRSIPSNFPSFRESITITSLCYRTGSTQIDCGVEKSVNLFIKSCNRILACLVLHGLIVSITAKK